VPGELLVDEIVREGADVMGLEGTKAMLCPPS